MAGEHKELRVRRVIAGIDSDGRSTIVSDGFTSPRLVTDTMTINQTWGLASVPSSIAEENALGEEAVIPPPPNGLYHVICAFAPDSEWETDPEKFKAAMAAAGASENFVEGQDPGMHETDTVDIITILSGECYVRLEKAETLLRTGDVFIQRGTKHAWKNKGDVPCVHSTVMIAARR